MTREEKAIIYFKDMRKRLCEDYLNICPKSSIAYKATLAEKEFYDTAIKALEQEPINKIVQKAYEDGKKDGYVQAKVDQEPTDTLDKIRAEIDAQREKLKIMADDDWYAGKIRGYDCAVEIIDKYKAESEGGTQHDRAE